MKNKQTIEDLERKLESLNNILDFMNNNIISSFYKQKLLKDINAVERVIALLKEEER